MSACMISLRMIGISPESPSVWADTDYVGGFSYPFNIDDDGFNRRGMMGGFCGQVRRGHVEEHHTGRGHYLHEQPKEP